MGELAAYSLIEFDRRNESYNIHALVQDWARELVREHNVSLERTTLLLSASIDMGDDPGSHSYRTRLGSHVQKVLSESKKRCEGSRPWEINANYAARFAEVFKSLEQWEDEGLLREKVKEATGEILGLIHPATLRSTDDLAHSYRNQGRLDEAERLYEEVLEARKTLYRKTHGEEHDDIHTSKRHLASLYQHQNRLDKAMPFWEDLVQGYKISKGGNNPETLGCMENLADAYCQSMQLEKAEALQKDMLGIMPDSHQGKPMCMRELAEVLELKGDWAAAEPLLVQSQQASDIYWGKNHVNAIVGQQHLYEFRVRRRSVPPVSCDSCTHTTEV
ncbi:hypothetical protein FRC11_005492, partial [Ceratobasidium sp. 423]